MKAIKRSFIYETTLLTNNSYYKKFHLYTSTYILDKCVNQLSASFLVLLVNIYFIISHVFHFVITYIQECICVPIVLNYVSNIIRNQKILHKGR